MLFKLPSLKSDRKIPPVHEMAVRLPEIGKISGPIEPIEPPDRSSGHRKTDLYQLALRLFCTATAAAAAFFMVTAKEASTVSFYGFQFPVHSRWSLSDSFEYLVGVSVAVAAYSLLQLVVTGSKLVRKSPVLTSTTHAWLIFAVDQALAYGAMSAGSAAAGVSNLNRTGISHSTLPNFCKPLQSFCNHVAISIAFAFLTCFFLAASALHSVIWLSTNSTPKR